MSPDPDSVQRSYGGRSAGERVADRRERLVAAAIDVLAERGAQATMTAICAHAGLTERYFYEHFTNLDEALLAALDAVADEIAQGAAHAVADTAGSSEDRLQAVMVSFVDLVVASPAKGRVAVIQANVLPSLRARRLELIGIFAGLVAREATDLYGDAAWPPDRGRVQGIVFIAGLAELVAGWLTGEVELSREDLIETAGNLFASLSRRP